MRTERPAVVGTEPLDGGDPPVTSSVPAVMMLSVRNHPTRKAVALAVPRRDVRMRMKGINGSGSNAIARPMTMRSRLSGDLPGELPRAYRCQAPDNQEDAKPPVSGTSAAGALVAGA